MCIVFIIMLVMYCNYYNMLMCMYCYYVNIHYMYCILYNVCINIIIMLFLMFGNNVWWVGPFWFQRLFCSFLIAFKFLF